MTDQALVRARLFLAFWVLLWLAFLFPASTLAERIKFEDLPLSVREALAAQGVTAEKFPGLIEVFQAIGQDRQVQAENRHIIYFVLQSNRFTKRPRIEPLASAQQFVDKLDPAERARLLQQEGARSRSMREKIPAEVLVRMADFLRPQKSDENEVRLAFFRQALVSLDREEAAIYLKDAYMDCARDLYQREGQAKPQPPARDSMGALYRRRGYTTDTMVEATYAVWHGLGVIGYLLAHPSMAAPEPAKPEAPPQINNVLIVGPGLDFAPQTALLDVFPPQSYQPFAVADALLSLKIADPARLHIVCVDLNARVVHAIRNFAYEKEPKLDLVSGFRAEELAPEFARYFQELGGAIGTPAPVPALPPEFDSHLKKVIAVRRQVAQAVSVWPLDIVTGRLNEGPVFDLVVVTNVFSYFDSTELALALVNINAMMKPGAYLLHNEPRQQMESLGRTIGLVPVQSGTLQISASGVKPPLFDTFVIQRKKAAEPRP